MLAIDDIYKHMNDTANYKKYVMRQMGLTEAQFAPLPKKEAIEPQISPTARPPTILALGIRGSTTGGLPSGADQMAKDISPTKVGGYDRVEPQKLNSKLVDKTPDNAELKQAAPINTHPSTGAGVTHPHQIQVTAHEEPQSVTGASTDSDPTLTLKSATPKGIEVDIPGENEEPEQEVHNEDDNTAMIPATSLSETFARNKKLMRERLGLKTCPCSDGECKCGPNCKCKKTGVCECATCGCGDPHDKHGMNEESDICGSCNGSGEGMADGTKCSTCGGSGDSKKHWGKKKHDQDDDDAYERIRDKKHGLDEGKHKKGCKCGFCMNKHRFGKKDDVDEASHDEDDDSHASDPDFKEKDEKQFRKDRSASAAGDEVRKHFDKDKKKVDEQQRLDESYAAPFQRMRSLAGVGNMILTSNGLFENKNDPGASKPFNTNWKMDKEKAGFVKIDEEKINKVKASLERKSKRGSLSDKEMELVKRMDEVLKRRSIKS